MAIGGRGQKQPMLLAAVGAILVVAAFVGWARQSDESLTSVRKPRYPRTPSVAITPAIAPQSLAQSYDSAIASTATAIATTAAAAGTDGSQTEGNKVGGAEAAVGAAQSISGSDTLHGESRDSVRAPAAANDTAATIRSGVVSDDPSSSI